MWVSCVRGRRYFPYYSYRRNPTGREFFVPARTLIVVFLLKATKQYGRAAQAAGAGIGDVVSLKVDYRTHSLGCV